MRASVGVTRQASNVREFLCAQRAQEVLEAYVERFPTPAVPPVEAELVGARLFDLHFMVVDTDFLGCGIEGALLPRKRIALISARCSTSGYFNFTCAHELGHWVLHRSRIEHVRRGEQRAFFEKEADWFAAELLMPGDLVRKAFITSRASRGTLARMFDVSDDAMRTRLEGLRLGSGEHTHASGGSLPVEAAKFPAAQDGET